ncbi:MAG: DUF2442 domain-containing protein [Nitrospirota bacterium]|nr:DUF2442 domain-containing protein [Nitrospirota bacterium]
MIKVISVEPVEQFKLNIVLSNGKKGLFDVSPYLELGAFHELNDQTYFRRVKISFGGIAWPNEQDLSADTIEHELQESTETNAGKINAA